MFRRRKISEMPTSNQALPGRSERMLVADKHLITGNPLQGPWLNSLQCAAFAMGCFWGAERKFWSLPGVYSTAVGYTAGSTPNPTYEEVCSGRSGHTEAVLVVFDPARVSYSELLKVFWESHDPTQGMRQGNDFGTQYRSGIYFYNEEQHRLAVNTQRSYQTALQDKNHGTVTTEILPAPDFYYAEDYHQQYLAKNPNGYCGLGGTGVTCTIT
jgi:peptide-methionine (S)-S-oxide reductase